MLKPVYKKIWKAAQFYLDTRRNNIHTNISIRFALSLLEREGGDDTVVVPAVILHDVGWKRVPEEFQLKAFGPRATMPEWNRVHEVEGYRIAGEILETLAYDRKKIKEIQCIVNGHDSRAEPISLNDRIVKDADKLWRYSRTGARINRERYSYSHAQYIHRLQSNLDAWFLTASGRETALQEMMKRISESSAETLP